MGDVKTTIRTRLPGLMAEAEGGSELSLVDSEWWTRHFEEKIQIVREAVSTLTASAEEVKNTLHQLLEFATKTIVLTIIEANLIGEIKVQVVLDAAIVETCEWSKATISEEATQKRDELEKAADMIIPENLTLS